MNILDNIIEIKDAAELWDLSISRIKTLCQNGEINAKKIGSSWAIDATQPNPKKYKLEEQNVKNENWYVFADAREDDGLSHEEAIVLLKERGCSEEEIEEITKKYYKWSVETAVE